MRRSAPAQLGRPRFCEENGRCSRSAFQTRQCDDVLAVFWIPAHPEVHLRMRVSLGCDEDGFHDAPIEPIA
jgi:hypothetical protein